VRGKFGTNHTQPKGAEMSIAADAACMVRRFEREDSLAFGGQQPARKALARKLCVAPGTLKNAREGRLKRICAEFFAALKREEMRRLTLSIQKAEADLAILQQVGVRADSPEMLHALALVEASRRIAEGAR
jgi:hypothetical protein